MSKFPYKLEECLMPGGETKVIRVIPGDWMMQYEYKLYAEKMYNFEVRPDDVWLISHPKTGTTWGCEMVWTLCNNADVEGATSVPQFTRWCFPDFDVYQEHFKEHYKKNNIEVSEEAKKELDRSYYDEAANRPSPRLIKCHLPLSLLPPNLVDTCKVIYIARNPLDTCVSFYHFIKGMVSTNPNLMFPMFVQIFMADILPFGPYWNHVKTAWEKRQHPNFMFITYEDMKQDLENVILKTREFLNKQISNAEMKRMLEYLSLKNMSKNRMVNMDIYKEQGMYRDTLKFMRKGIVGDFKNNLSEQEIEQLKQWWNRHMKDSGLTFPGVDISKHASTL